MFDKKTANLIASAPQLPGLDIKNLPQALTDAYATIVTARVRMRNFASDPLFLGKVAAEIQKMRRLAFTYEAFVAAVPDRKDREATAFVAGSAHHVCLMAEKLEQQARPYSKLAFDAIPPQLAAMLLFLIAEATADAAEMAKAIVIEENRTVESALLNALVYLARGKLQKIEEIPILRLAQMDVARKNEQAVSGLYLMLLKGVVALAKKMIHLDKRHENEAIEIFRHVKLLCSEPIAGFSEENQPTSVNIFPGPLHLASLLIAVASDIASTAVINIKPPGNIDPQQWGGRMEHIAKNRPYLWWNHRQAIAEDYLEPGTSAAVSFPTGAGKSTLSELKIAVSLLCGGKVIFLAPTLALVDQTANALAVTFDDLEVQRERSNQGIFADFFGEKVIESLPSITVMTPERCLATLSYNRAIFSEVSLLVFDECHLLHGQDTERSRRAIDAMLCVLNFVNIAPDADLLLLSAMMKNTSDIANWVCNMTGRPCLSLELTWKPTRQARGCVVYDAESIKLLNQKLKKGQIGSKAKGVPTALQKELYSRPFGLFSLHQTWQSKQRDDYVLLPLLDEAQPLRGAGKTFWEIKPNGNKVAAAIAEATVKQQLKTLIFTQTIPWVNSTVRTLNDQLGNISATLSSREKDLYNAAIEEAGSAEHIYLEVTNGLLSSSCVCHHGLLLPTERHLHESLFQRPDGITVMVATSTLAQGMNLPSEVVIIVGDSRFDPQAEKMEQLDAHEVLNAAGRAGRAGESAYGMVIMVPTKVIDFSDGDNTINKYWENLQAVFGQSDQCLNIKDPLAALLDQIQLSQATPTEMMQYFISRLPVELNDEAKPDVDGARVLLRKSFGAYIKRAKEHDPQWIEARITTVLALRDKERNNAPITWVERLAANIGVPLDVIRYFGEWLNPLILPDLNSIFAWKKCVFEVISNKPDAMIKLVRQTTLEGLFGTPYKELTTDANRGSYALPKLEKMLDVWMAGGTLANIEIAFGTAQTKLGKCENAREFVIRMVPELAYVFGLPLLVAKALHEEKGRPDEIPGLALETLGRCVKEGFDVPEKLVLKAMKDPISRIAAHLEFAKISAKLQPASEAEDFDMAFRRVRGAL